MEQRRQGGRRVSEPSDRGPQLPNYMKRPAASGNSNRSNSETSPKRQTKQGTNSGSQKRRRKPDALQKILRILVIVFASLLLVVAGVMLFSGKGEKNPAMLEYLQSIRRYKNGVTIEGIEVGSLSIEEARPLVEQAVSKQLRSVSITLEHEGNSWAFTAADMNLNSNLQEVLNEAISFGRIGSKDSELEDAKSFFIELKAERKALVNRLNLLAPEIGSAPIEPYAIPELGEGNKPVFTPAQGKNGYKLDTEATADIIEDALNKRHYQHVINPVLEYIPPSLTLDFIMANTEYISSFTTRFARSSSDQVVKNRVFNIQKAAERINCYTVQQGEEWSFNGWVGPRTKSEGWKEANGISGGKEYTLQAGGGICQVSTTLYNALLCGRIPVIDRKKHSIPSDYVPKALDATVDTSGIDLKFLNDTEAPLYIFVYITPDPKSSRHLNITVSLYGRPLPEGVSYKTRSEIIEVIPRIEPKYKDDPTVPVGYQLEVVKARDGFIAKAYRDKYVNGKLESSEYLYEDKYNGNEAEIHIGTGNPMTTPVPLGAVPIGGVQEQDDIPESPEPAGQPSA